MKNGKIRNISCSVFNQVTSVVKCLKRFNCNLEIQGRDFSIELKQLLSGGEEINACKCLVQLWRLSIISVDLSFLH